MSVTSALSAAFNCSITFWSPRMNSLLVTLGSPHCTRGAVMWVASKLLLGAKVITTHRDSGSPPAGTGCGLYVLSRRSFLIPSNHFSDPCDSIASKVCPSHAGCALVGFHQCVGMAQECSRGKSCRSYGHQQTGSS